MNGKRLTNKILSNLAKPRPERTEAEVFRGLGDGSGALVYHSDKVAFVASVIPEACVECGRAKSEFVEGPVLRCLRCQKALCFLCTGPHLDCRNRCEEAK